jgi:hypothetical protein
MKNEIQENTFMIRYVYDECNIINHMIDVGMVDINYITNG